MKRFRRGQWVVWMPERRVGIHVRELSKGLVEVHLTDRKGETEIVVTPPVSEVRPARKEEIPAARLKTVNKKVLDRLYPGR